METREEQHNKWLNDLNEGQKGERVIAEHIINKKDGEYEIVEFGNDHKYDFKLESKLKETYIYFEVKTDRYEYFKDIHTGNLFIEVSCSGKPSGVSTTQADYFVYYFPDKELAYLIKVNDLKTLLLTEDHIRSTQSGDGGRVSGYLINRETWGHKFIILKIKKDTEIWTN
jgi:hypothetical protein